MIRKTNDTNPTWKIEDWALSEALIKSDWEECRELLKHSEALHLVQYRYRDDPGNLTLACMMNTPVDIVRLICETDPEKLTLKDSNNISPVEIAVRHSSEDVVTYMLSVAPPNAKLPSCFAINCKRSPSLIKIMIQRDLAAANFDHYMAFIAFITSWTHDLDVAYPDLQRMPHGCVFDGNIEGLTLFKETFLLLLMAYIHGTVDNTELPQSWLPMKAALSIKETLSPVFLFALDNTMHAECVRYDKERNFPLHIVCAQSPEFYAHGSDGSDSSTSGNNNTESDADV